jgi:hypothetical protein
LASPPPLPSRRRGDHARQRDQHAEEKPGPRMPLDALHQVRAAQASGVGGRMIAALFVETGGAYFNIEGVDPWDEDRDARKYAGPWPVVAHPPCARWGRYWFGSTRPGTARRERGDDGGCFTSAAQSVQRWGGALEHPQGSSAWVAHNLAAPQGEGWSSAGLHAPGWVCSVDQGRYGHRAGKPTWLYFVGDEKPPDLIWGRSDTGLGERSSRVGQVALLSRKQRRHTPPAFRDLLLSLAQSATTLESTPNGCGNTSNPHTVPRSSTQNSER